MFKIGDKAKGFKFDSDTDSVHYDNEMDDYVDMVGEVVEVYSHSFVIMFPDHLEWMYPASLCHLAKMDEESSAFKVGDHVKFKKSSIDSGMIDSDESCSYKVIAVDADYQWLKIYQNGWPTMYHPNHFEHVKEEIMNNTEDREIKWEGSQIDWRVGQEVFCLLRGKGVVHQIHNTGIYWSEGIEVHFPIHGVIRYKFDGTIGSGLNRSLFFSEPKIEAEKFPPKKPFVPKLKKGDVILVKVKDELYGEGTVRTVHSETDDRIYISEKHHYFLKKDILSIRILSEEIIFN